jgi:hypothetical protein
MPSIKAVFSAFLIAFTLISCPSNFLSAEQPEHEPFPETMMVDVFFNERKGEFHRIAGVEGKKLLRLGEDNKFEKMKHGAYASKPWLARVDGHLAVYDVVGTTGSMGGTISNYQVYTLGGATAVEFSLCSDRDLEGVWVAMKFFDAETEDLLAVSFGSIGDLEKGKRSIRKIKYQIEVEVGIKFTYQFFAKGGYPLIDRPIGQICDHPQTRSWGIPWEERLKAYLDRNDYNSANYAAKPFLVSEMPELFEKLKSRGQHQFKMKLSVNTDGTVSVVENDPGISPEEIPLVKEALVSWRCFPALQNGSPVVQEIPVQLEI